MGSRSDNKGKDMISQPCPFGFEWGSTKITRLFFNEKDGWITLGITTPKDELQIYVTKTGKVRVWNKKGEMKVEKTK